MADSVPVTSLAWWASAKPGKSGFSAVSYGADEALGWVW